MNHFFFAFLMILFNTLCNGIVSPRFVKWKLMQFLMMNHSLPLGFHHNWNGMLATVKVRIAVGEVPGNFLPIWRKTIDLSRFLASRTERKKQLDKQNVERNFFRNKFFFLLIRNAWKRDIFLLIQKCWLKLIVWFLTMNFRWRIMLLPHRAWNSEKQRKNVVLQARTQNLT